MKKIFFYLLMSFIFCSCNNDNCSKNLEFNLDYHLFDSIEIEGKTYCELVNNALRKNNEAILNISKVDVGDGASYQHGAVLIEIIDKITEEKYLNIISALSIKKQKEIYYSYISAGLEFTINPKYENKTIADAFPKLTKQLE